MNWKKIIPGIIAAALLLPPCLGWAQGADTTYVAGEALIKVYSPFGEITKEDSLVKTGTSWFDTLSQQYGIYELFDVFRSSQPRFQGYYKLEFPTTVDVAVLCSDFESQAEVDYAEPNYILRTCDLPSDSLYIKQWALRRIQAPDAWDVTTGSEEVILAIVDTGSDTSHPDLRNNLWRNPGEIPNNSLDDDGNGYVDDYYGYDFVPPLDPDPTDDNGHGTHVAGIAAAVTNNTSGIAGLAGGWYPQVGVKILSAKACNAGGLCHQDWVAEAIRYAADPDDDPTTQDGAGVINMSWGKYDFYQTLYAAISYADSQDVVLVASAGNACGDMSDRPQYPAAWDECIGVASTDSNDIRSSFSTCADWVDVSAPGGVGGDYDSLDQANILSTTPTYPDFALHYYLPMNYGYMRGTSMSSPYVAGLAALIRSLYPNLSSRDVRGHILGTADEVYPENEDYVGVLGAGRINAYRALTEAPHPSLVYWGQQVDDSEGSNDGAVNVGETVDFAVLLKNFWIEGIGITGRLSTSDPGIVINKDLGSFGTIGNERIGDNSADPFNFTVALGGSPRKALFNLHLWTQDSIHSMDVTVPVDIGAPLVGNFPFRIGSMSQSSPVVIDLDGDGSKEIVVGADDGKLYVVSHDGELEETFQTGGAIRSSPAIADLDGDGDLELIVGSDDQKVYAWHHTNPANPIFAFNTGGIVHSSPAIGDVNGDGGLEIVIGSVDTIGADLYVLSPSGSVVWSFSTGKGVEASPGLADVNGDGVPDVIAFTMAKTHESQPAMVYAFDVKGDSVIWNKEAEVAYSALEIIGSPVIGDIDEDGGLEILFYGVDTLLEYASDCALNAEDGSDFWTDVDQRVMNAFYQGRSFVVGNIFPDVSGLESSGPSGQGYGDELDIRDCTGQFLLFNHEYGRTGIPVIVDADNNGFPEMIYAAVGIKPSDKGIGEICILDKDNQMLNGWPAVVGDTVASSLAVDDLDGDGLTDIVFVTQNGKVYALDTGLPFNGDGVEWGMYQHDRWHTGLYGAVPTRRVSGYITKNTTWSDKVVVLGDVTVDSGVVLTVQAGTNVTFMANQDYQKSGVDTLKCELIVYGTLTVQGTSSEPVTFTSTSSNQGDWYGIRVLNGGSADIQHATIQSGYCGLRLHSGSIDTVKNCHITQNELYGIRCETDDAYIYKNTIDYNERYGIYVHNHSPDIVDNVVANYPQSTPSYDIYCYFQTQTSSLMYGNILKGNPHGVGLYLYRSRPLVKKCKVESDSIGIVVFDSDPVITESCTLSTNQIGLSCDCLAHPTFKKGDILNSTIYGVYCTGGSYPVIGGSSGNCCEITGSGVYHVYNDNHPKQSYVMAERNWWGARPPDPDKFEGLVDYNPYNFFPCPREFIPKEALAENLPQEFSLSQNYPNPFNPTTVIKYALPEDQYVSLKVYNLLGQVVTTLVDGQKAAGYYQVLWSGRNSSGQDVASGVYFYRIKAGNFVKVKKLVLLR